MGFQQDLYKKNQAKLDSRCFDKESEDEIAQIMWVFYSPGPEEVLDALIGMANLFYDDYVVCHYENAIHQFVKHCRIKVDNCQGEAIVKNMQTNIFYFVEVLTSVLDVATGNNIEDV